MSFEEAIHASKDGAVIDFEVTPGSRSAEVPSGYNQWRKRIEAKLRAPPEKGKANEELIEALADLFNVAARNIEITAGATNSKKSVLVRGVSADAAARVLEGLLHG
jgi:uncharacterized protein (TIGR00251 family)